MSDIYFKNYKKKDDTGEIPITQSEKDFQDRLTQQKYEEILRNQQRLGTFEGYSEGERPNYQNEPSPQRNRPPQKTAQKKKTKNKGLRLRLWNIIYNLSSSDCFNPCRKLWICLFPLLKDKLC